MTAITTKEDGPLVLSGHLRMTMTDGRDPFTMNGNIVTTRLTMEMEFLFG